MKNFDRFIGIDWSGAKSPIFTKSISVAECSNIGTPKLLNQKWSRQGVADYIESLLEKNERILIGIDCNFGYASDILERQIGVGKNAFDLWAEVEKYYTGIPNFFAGQFWVNKKYAPYFWTGGKMPDGFQMPQRLTEIKCRDNGFGNPESPFKMIGAKQVGKGGLSGMRMAHYLKQRHGHKIAIWPFDNIEICNQATIVITEIYPRQFIKRAQFGQKKIRNSDDLNTILFRLNSAAFLEDFHSDHDSDAIISAAGLRHLCGDKNELPTTLSHPHENQLRLQQEGWIFGVGYKI